MGVAGSSPCSTYDSVPLEDGSPNDIWVATGEDGGIRAKVLVNRREKTDESLRLYESLLTLVQQLANVDLFANVSTFKFYEDTVLPAKGGSVRRRYYGRLLVGVAPDTLTRVLMIEFADKLFSNRWRSGTLRSPHTMENLVPVTTDARTLLGKAFPALTIAYNPSIHWVYGVVSISTANVTV